MRQFVLSASLVASVFSAGTACAASLQVAPVSVDMVSPKQSATIHLRNTGDRPVQVQVRVFKWSQVEGRDILTPTTEVIASPPAASLKQETSYTIRLARTASPVQSGELAYRLLVDQLPEVNVKRPATEVDMVVRYSLPIFFGDRSAAADLKWDVRQDSGRLLVRATNRGDRHVKVANLTITPNGGSGLSAGKGLNGYVLPGSTKEWSVSVGGRHARSISRVTITARGDDYDISETATVAAR